MEGSEVLHGEFPLEGRYGVMQKCCAGCGEDNVINVKQHVYYICATPEDEQGRVGLGLSKPQGSDVCGKPDVPCPGHLLKPVQRLIEKANTIGLRRINKSSRLGVIDGLREGVIHEYILHIESCLDRWVNRQNSLSESLCVLTTLVL
jgi:hypothetical protein